MPIRLHLYYSLFLVSSSVSMRSILRWKMLANDHSRSSRSSSSRVEVAPFQWTVSRLAGYVVVMVACMSAS